MRERDVLKNLGPKAYSNVAHSGLEIEKVPKRVYDCLIMKSIKRNPTYGVYYPAALNFNRMCL